MYSKGNEQVLEKEQVLGKGKTNPLSCFFFVLILNVFRAENLFCFSLGNEFLFSSVCLKLQICFLSVNVVAFSLIKTHFVFGEFWFY
jgi:hypothetical protein